jgi:hypothetical protein
MRMFTSFVRRLHQPSALCTRHFVLLTFLLAACQATAPANLPPTAIPFPTMTLGRVVHGILPTTVGLPLDGAGLANPATAVALANQPTPTPNYSQCPGSASADVPPRPQTGQEIVTALITFLSNGGSPLVLPTMLGDDWGLLSEKGVIRTDLDFTGEGLPDILATYAAPDDGGTLLVLTCLAGSYTPLHQVITGSPDVPEIIQLGDMNFDARADILSGSHECSAENPEDCAYRTQLLTFSRDQNRFISLFNGTITSTELPSISDIDNDRVQEIIVRLTDDGNAITGPLRTGVNIYDWNGVSYVLSIVQLDAPRFQIQVVHEADRAFARQEMDEAIRLYKLALTDTSLRYWLNDEPAYLKSYVYYRLILAMAFSDSDELLPTYQTALNDYPDASTAPVYITMINTLWNGFQVTNNLHSACLEVQAIIAGRPEAIGLLNRYGSRSPAYTAQDLCPF